MVAYAFEEDATCQWRELESMDLNVDSIIVPCVKSYSVGYEASDEPVEIGKEKDCPRGL